jgi:hypothetical protein
MSSPGLPKVWPSALSVAAAVTGLVGHVPKTIPTHSVSIATAVIQRRLPDPDPRPPKNDLVFP